MNTLQSPYYREKWGLPTIDYFLFLFWLKNMNCWYSLEPPHRGGSVEHPQFMSGDKIRKLSQIINRKMTFVEPESKHFITQASFPNDVSL